MLRVAVLALDNVPLTSLALPVDIFNAAGVLWNKMAGIPVEQLCEVVIVSPGGEPVQSYGSCVLRPEAALESIEPPDILLIGGLFDVVDVHRRLGHVIEYLATLHREGTVLASVCTGAFLLAATGLLNGKSAATHWGAAQMFRRQFPQVRLRADATVVDEHPLLSSGGTSAGADLALYLVRKHFGRDIADRCARVLMLDPYRSSQAPYEIMVMPTDHGDPDVLKVQQWIGKSYAMEMTVEAMAGVCSLSRRTFERRFKKATGESPLRYLQRIRVDRAKHLLTARGDSFESITYQVGYEDPSSFRRVFRKSTGLTPGMYREKFSPNPGGR